MTFIAAPDPSRPRTASDEMRYREAQVRGPAAMHHVASTSVPGLPARPVIDLLAVYRSDEDRVAARAPLEAMGYGWAGECGLPGRADLRKNDAATGKRAVRVNGYAGGHGGIARHVAFRDTLRDIPALRAADAPVKGACAARHPDGGARYGACKSGWIDRVEARAPGGTA